MKAIKESAKEQFYNEIELVLKKYRPLLTPRKMGELVALCGIEELGAKDGTDYAVGLEHPEDATD